MRMIHRLALGLALVLTWSCKQGAAPASGSSTPRDSGQVAVRNPSDTAFSPAEIRRSGSRPEDSTASSAQPKTDSVAAAKAPAQAAPEAKPVESPKPVAPVPAPSVKTPPPVAPPTPAPVAKPVEGGDGPGSDGEWVLQINIHKSEAEARAQVQKLADQGIAAYAIPVPTGETKLSGDYWRVRVGRFRERAKAQAWGEANIVPRGLKFWVDKKSNENRSSGNP